MSDVGSGPNFQGDLQAGLQIDEAVQIDEICDRFEEAWQAGLQPNIADFLPETAQPTNTQLFLELVRIDLEYRSRSGDRRSPLDYVRDFPQFSEAISSLEADFEVAPTLTVTDAEFRVGHYRLMSEVGRGAFGTVWRAWDETLQRLVAIKFPGERLGQQLATAIFLREARAAAQLDHPHIVRVHDFGEEQDQGYIVFEFIQGITLKQWLAGKQLLPQQAASIVAAVADGLDHAHARGVVHRDIKPANILMDGAGQPRISDFGLAKRMDNQSTIASPGKLLGTVPYMSPEQAAGTGKGVDGRSDIYSLGVILYQMLVGRLPFSGDTNVLLHKIRFEEPVPPRQKNKQTPRDLETICLKALAKRPEERYQTAGELRDDLSRFLKGEPIKARRTPLAVRAWRKVNRNRVVAASVVVGLCGLLTAGAYALREPPDGKRLVSITSEPEGAKVAFVPLHAMTGEPLPLEIVKIEKLTPIQVRLQPGDYLVEAYLDDGRFHEVYRHVPHTDEQTVLGPQRHLRWTVEVAKPGEITLPAITIPALEIASGMAAFEGSERFSAGRSGSTTEPPHMRRVPSFLLDTTEVSLARYRPFFGGEGPYDGRSPIRSDDHAVILNWDWAVHLAEKLGKRLPTEYEYEFAATNRGTQHFPCGEILPASDETEFKAVGQPSFDRLPSTPPVFGLCSNVAEWTMSCSNAHPAGASTPVWSPSMTAHRVVRGGSLENINNNAHVSETNRDPRHRVSVWRSTVAGGLGLRCARSAKPRLNPEDFQQVIP